MGRFQIARKPLANMVNGFLNANDPVAISFWIISIAMVAATVFFLMEAAAVKMHWKTSMHIGALVTLVAAVHYFYMREYWSLSPGGAMETDRDLCWLRLPSAEC